MDLTIRFFKNSAHQKIGDLEHFWAEISGVFTRLWPSEGSRRPNRTAVTPIGQQNPPGRLKLLVLDQKIGINTDFDFAQITLKILD